VSVQADGDIVGKTPIEIRVAPMAADFLIPNPTGMAASPPFGG
jgi:diacylglycerol kinase family enzyme